MKEAGKQNKGSAWRLKLITNLRKNRFCVTRLEPLSEEAWKKEKPKVEWSLGEPSSMLRLRIESLTNLAQINSLYEMVAKFYVFVETWAWDKDDSYLKRNRPIWDDCDRLSSHEDKKVALPFELQWTKFSAKYVKTLTRKS